MPKIRSNIQVAREISKEIHRDEDLKCVNHDTYFNNHILPVVQCMRSVDEKIVAFLHDVTEKAVSDENKRRAKAELPPLNPMQEEAIIEKRLQWIVDEFRKHGDHHITRHFPIIEDLNVLTKRTHEKKDYARYGQRIIDYAHKTGRLTVIMVKKADLLNNLDPDRNPSIGDQTSKDIKRLTQYKELLGRLDKAFPKITLRLFLKDRPNRKEYKRPVLTSSGRKFKKHRYG